MVAQLTRRVGDPDKLRVIKGDYSHHPWRILNDEGLELANIQPYPGGGLPPYLGPLAFPRKRDAVAALEAIREGQR